MSSGLACISVTCMTVQLEDCIGGSVGCLRKLTAAVMVENAGNDDVWVWSGGAARWLSAEQVSTAGRRGLRVFELRLWASRQKLVLQMDGSTTADGCPKVERLSW
ncbi:hypothetical protein M0R45_019065 [Rubus argutus]|uniref:Uncharacterized protein n=1 Tax=Rubus argutus TaxID=59490 RepID=A0AAW1X4C7_RUBAR